MVIVLHRYDDSIFVGMKNLAKKDVVQKNYRQIQKWKKNRRHRSAILLCSLQLMLLLRQMTVVEFLGEEPALSLNSSSSSSFVNNEIINYYQRDRSSLLRNRNTKHMNINFLGNTCICISIIIESAVKGSFRSFPQFKNYRPFILALKKSSSHFKKKIYALARFSDKAYSRGTFYKKSLCGKVYR